MRTITLVIAWTIVALPLGWGVYQSVRKAMPLFSAPSKPNQESSLDSRLVSGLAKDGLRTDLNACSGNLLPVI